MSRFFRCDKCGKLGEPMIIGGILREPMNWYEWIGEMGSVMHACSAECRHNIDVVVPVPVGDPAGTGMMFTMGELIEKQREFQVKYIRLKYGKDLYELILQERENLIISQVLRLMGECYEFLDKATNWKDHREAHILDREAAIEEYIDIGKYWINIFIYMEMTPHEFLSQFRKKSQLVLERWEREIVNPIHQRKGAA